MQYVNCCSGTEPGPHPTQYPDVATYIGATVRRVQSRIETSAPNDVCLFITNNARVQSAYIGSFVAIHAEAKRQHGSGPADKIGRSFIACEFGLQANAAGEEELTSGKHMSCVMWDIAHDDLLAVFAHRWR